MKLSNKIFGAAAAIAIAAVMLTGCPQTVGETGKIGKDITEDNSANASSYKRGYTTLNTKHTSASALITLPTYEGTNANGAGVIGFIFGIKDGSDKTVDGEKSFGLVGLRRNKNNNLQCYVSYFTNVAVDNENLKKNNFTDSNGNLVNTPACSSATKEDEIVKDSGDGSGFATLTGATLTAGTDEIIRVDVYATDASGKQVESGKGNGTYKVVISTTGIDGVTAKTELKTATIPNEDTLDSVATQYDLGLYTCAYKSQTLTGKLWLTDVVNEAGIVEE